MKHAAIGIRLPKDMLSQIEKLSHEAREDRSTVIRKLVMIGYADFIKERAAQQYLSGAITLSEAAHQADLTLWDMEQYLVGHGFKSSYSIDDLSSELTRLGRGR